MPCQEGNFLGIGDFAGGDGPIDGENFAGRISVLIAARDLLNYLFGVDIVAKDSAWIITYLKFINARGCQGQAGAFIEESG